MLPSSAQVLPASPVPHRLATLGYDVVVFDGRPKPGGLNEHGIASYKSTNNFAQAEVEWILDVGGIELRCEQMLGQDFTLADLRRDFDAVFLGLGLQAVNALGSDDDSLDGVEDAVAFIEALRQSTDLSTLPIGRRVVVIGGGMTAVDAAVQAKKLGAEEVTIVYRRGAEQMGASRYEQELALTHGVVIRHWARLSPFMARTVHFAPSVSQQRRTGMDDSSIQARLSSFRQISSSSDRPALHSAGPGRLS